MRCIEIILVSFLFLPGTTFSQEILKAISPVDSLSNINIKNKEDLRFKKIFRKDSKKQISKDDLLGLALYSSVINDSTILSIYSDIHLAEYSEEELTYFKASFRQLMEIAKKNHYKYDLGEVGRYLGISRNVVAIILATLSVAK